MDDDGGTDRQGGGGGGDTRTANGGGSTAAAATADADAAAASSLERQRRRESEERAAAEESEAAERHYAMVEAKPGTRSFEDSSWRRKATLLLPPMSPAAAPLWLAAATAESWALPRAAAVPLAPLAQQQRCLRKMQRRRLTAANLATPVKRKREAAAVALMTRSVSWELSVTSPVTRRWSIRPSC